MFFDFESVFLELKRVIFQSFFRKRFAEAFFSILGRILIKMGGQMGPKIDENRNYIFLYEILMHFKTPRVGKG